MTTLYKPAPITSVEQAEALPVGTVALATIDGEQASAEKLGDDLWMAAGYWPDYFNEEAVGWTALVPIEAEEEWTAMGSANGDPWIAHVGHDGIDGSREEAEAYTRRFGGVLARRAFTPWEEA